MGFSVTPLCCNFSSSGSPLSRGGAGPLRPPTCRPPARPSDSHFQLFPGRLRARVPPSPCGGRGGGLSNGHSVPGRPTELQGWVDTAGASVPGADCSLQGPTGLHGSRFWVLVQVSWDVTGGLRVGRAFATSPSGGLSDYLGKRLKSRSPHKADGRILPALCLPGTRGVGHFLRLSAATRL